MTDPSTHYEALVEHERRLRYALHPDPNDPDHPGWDEPQDTESDEEEEYVD